MPSSSAVPSPASPPSDPSGAHPMKILFPVKRVVDYNVKVRVKSDSTGVDIANLKMSMNPLTRSPSRGLCFRGRSSTALPAWPRGAWAHGPGAATPAPPGLARRTPRSSAKRMRHCTRALIGYRRGTRRRPQQRARRASAALPWRLRITASSSLRCSFVSMVRCMPEHMAAIHPIPMIQWTS